MADILLYGWDAGDATWRKLSVNADGKLIVNPADIFENPPVEDETKKAPSSEWAYDHWKNVAAHHAKYTDANSRSAIGGALNSDGRFILNLLMSYKGIRQASYLRFKKSAADTTYISCDKALGAYELKYYTFHATDGVSKCELSLYSGSGWEKVCVEPVADSKIATHKAIVNAHHTKYTAAEAQEACNLDGTLYWTCPGSNFIGSRPDTDDLGQSSSGYVEASADAIYLRAPVSLPHGATVTGVIVYGNLSSELLTWELRRMVLATATATVCATAVINTEDTTITGGVIDNSAETYLIAIADLQTDDRIYGARIKYTL